jgi:hypothetical protein
VLSQVKAAVTFVAADEPVLQTLAPTGNVSGPEVRGLLLSRPTTSQVIGVMVRTAAARPGCENPNAAINDPTVTAATMIRANGGTVVRRGISTKIALPSSP